MAHLNKSSKFCILHRSSAFVVVDGGVFALLLVKQHQICSTPRTPITGWVLLNDEGRISD
jgi:hypothetical protein